MVFNGTLNNILVISWWSVLLVEETGVPRGNHQPDKLQSDNVVWVHFAIYIYIYSLVIPNVSFLFVKKNYYTILPLIETNTGEVSVNI
jgi:hypothetical protein